MALMKQPIGGGSPPSPVGPNPAAGPAPGGEAEFIASMTGEGSAVQPMSGDPPATPMGDEAPDEAQVEQFLDKSYELIYGGDTAEGEMSSPVSAMLRGGPDGEKASDPVGALADTAATVSSRVIGAALEAQFPLDPAAAFMGMQILVGELADNAGKEGLYDYSQEEVNAAGVRAGESLYQQTEGMGFFNQEEMEGDMNQLQSDSQSGQLDRDVQEIEGLEAAMGGDTGGASGSTP